MQTSINEASVVSRINFIPLALVFFFNLMKTYFIFLPHDSTKIENFLSCLLEYCQIIFVKKTA